MLKTILLKKKKLKTRFISSETCGKYILCQFKGTTETMQFFFFGFSTILSMCILCSETHLPMKLTLLFFFA